MSTADTDTLIGRLLTVFAVVLYKIDLSGIDAKILEPLAHVGVFCSGATAVVLLVIGRIEKIKEKKNADTGKKSNH